MNKTILITGASGGIGEGCARKFASQGARLILNARNAGKLIALSQELKEKYDADCYVMPFDVCDRESAAIALNALPEDWKSIDVL
ncbi:MAG: SDR family NAD(P)-dependent oxidoreductase, partial [Bacteroidaceae bacterium]|nr:SDR family NAD(P)-dependent oxidoreductase [Bacteroidaceae bacterium]